MTDDLTGGGKRPLGVIRNAKLSAEADEEEETFRKELAEHFGLNADAPWKEIMQHPGAERFKNSIPGGADLG